MTSVLNVDTIAAKDGTSPVELTKQVAAKVRWNYDQVNNTIKSSLNTSSVTDHSEGQFSITIANNMSDNNFAIAGLCQTNAANSAALGINGQSWAAGTCRYLNAATDNTIQDVNNNSAAYFGDLA